MKVRAVKRVFLLVLGLIAAGYLVLVLMYLGEKPPMTIEDLDTETRSVAVFGATGTIGDGLLKAALADPNIRMVHVVTRRPSPRIEEGVASGKAAMTLHTDYLDYAGLESVLADVDDVYWAIGLSSAGMDEDPYREIHVNYPLQFVREWLAVSTGARSFHYVSGAGTDSQSRMMWARVKAEAERELATLAEDTNLRVVSYRPSFIMPTEAEAGFGHQVMRAILRPIGAIVEAEAIGQAMLAVSQSGQSYPNASIIENKQIIAIANAYEATD